MNITNIAKRIPGSKRTWDIYKKIRLNVFRIYKKLRLKILDTEGVFTKIYRINAFGGVDSISGSGSDLIQTKAIVRELPNLFKDMNVSTVLDIPCGDFHWMRTVDLNNIRYTGADIVRDIVQQNRVRYAERKKISFHCLDLIKDDLPKVDLIICRDCLVHLSFNDVFLALKNICRSKSTYLLTTTFTGRKSNSDILTGEWRPLNIVALPFRLPDPIRVINERCTEGDGRFADKSLGLWRIEDIANSLGTTPRR